MEGAHDSFSRGNSLQQNNYSRGNSQQQFRPRVNNITADPINIDPGQEEELQDYQQLEQPTQEDMQDGAAEANDELVDELFHLMSPQVFTRLLSHPADHLGPTSQRARSSPWTASIHPLNGAGIVPQSCIFIAPQKSLMRNKCMLLNDKI